MDLNKVIKKFIRNSIGIDSRIFIYAVVILFIVSVLWLATVTSNYTHSFVNENISNETSNIINLAAVITVLICVLIASISDIRTMHVPHKIIIFMLLLSIPFNFFSGDIFIWILNIIAAFLIGFAFWRLCVWGGGDAKVLIGIAALIPQYHLFGILPHPAYSNFFFLIVMMNLLIVYLGYAIFLIASNSVKDNTLGSFLYDSFKYFSGILSLIFIGGLLNLGFILTIISLFGFIMLYKRIPSFVIFAVIFSGAISIFNMNLDFEFIKNYDMLLFIIFVLFLYKYASKLTITKTVKISELKEGDNIAEIITLENNEFIRKEKETPHNLISFLKEVKDAFTSKKTINVIAELEPGGIEKNDVEHLKGLVKEGKLEDRIEIYTGMPMTPLIFISLVISLFIGDIVGWISL